MYTKKQQSILRDIYLAATPPIDMDKLPKNQKLDPSKFTIAQAKLDEVLKKHGLTMKDIYYMLLNVGPKVEG